MFEEVSIRAPHILHPRSNQIELKPWGFREFAVRDKTDVCVVFRQPAILASAQMAVPKWFPMMRSMWSHRRSASPISKPADLRIASQDLC
jgi:hypothetical protein